MIRVKISNKNNLVNQVQILGHADYDEYGKDIVCSAVSSIVTTTINGILMFDKNYISYSENKDKFEIIINVHNEIVDNLINNMLNMLKEIEVDYPKNIKLKEENL
ncbi:MAG: ribosomal-processing cysteine protease Prp [Bacilli bacterium]|nr:ribosomal-processing cysteine protease Prp [Bacilli bacterium]